MCKRLGIYGGSFDPVHIGHLVMAELVRQECKLNKVLFIPAGNPPHKTNRQLAPALERYDMVQLAIEGNPYFEVSSIEIEREGKSFTIDTLKELREIYSSSWEFWLIIGMDSLLEIKTWRKVDEIVKICNLAVYARPGYSLDANRKEIETLRRELGDIEIAFVPGPLIGISSTEIRQRIRANKSIRYLVPEAVQAYIQEHSLYK